MMVVSSIYVIFNVFNWSKFTVGLQLPKTLTIKLIMFFGWHILCFINSNT